MISDKSLQVITVPMKMKNQIKKFYKLKEIKNEQKILKDIRKGDLSRPVITCKNESQNFYYGQTYEKFGAVPLTSQHWESKKKKGDHFIIHKHSENPAFSYCETNTCFEDLGLDEKIINNIKNCGFLTPTSIQSIAIPVLLEGQNTIISAETGNGKTLSFLAPIVQKILHKKKEYEGCEVPYNSPLGLILLPSRELVTQTRDTARKICGDLNIRINSIYGGRTKRLLLHPRLDENDILIGSFGAVSKLFSNGVYRTSRLNHVVLDEADTLLDDSFNAKMKSLLQKFALSDCHNEEKDEESVGAQLILVGATFPTNLNRILKNVVDFDNFKQIRTPYLHRISPHVTHTFLKLGACDRLEALMKIAKKNFRNKIPTIIFCNKSPCSNFVTNFLNDNDMPCINVNGSMNAKDRINRFERFQSGEFNFVACTDLVSRGLDTVRAKHVINFDFPRFMSDYIHRSGRTGRVGNEGDCHVTNFVFRESDAELVQKIEYAARKIKDLPDVNANIKRAFVKEAEERNQIQSLEEEEKEKSETMEQEIKHFVNDKPPL